MARKDVAALKAELERIKGNMRIRAGLAVRSTAIVAEAEAQARCPVDTGALRGSIRAEKDPKDPFTWYLVAGNDEVDYADFVEYGTVKMAARPFLAPAADIAREALRRDLERLMEP